MRAVAVLSAVVFGIVSIAHLLRVVLGLPVVAGSYAVPMWMSAAGAIGAGAL